VPLGHGPPQRGAKILFHKLGALPGLDEPNLIHDVILQAPHDMERKMLKIANRAFLLGSALAILLPLAAQAASPEFCRDYAIAAVRQVQLERSIPACDRGRGPRWTSDYRVHFSWCLGAAPAAAMAERAARTNWLRSCRGM
jgi:hypothetical protein